MSRRVRLGEIKEVINIYDEKPVKIAHNVYMVGGPMSAAEDCQVYLLENGGELLLIDSGCGPSVPLILNNIQGLGFQLAQIKTIIATHAHIDHSGGLAEMVRLFAPKVLAHREEVEAFQGKNPSRVAADFYGLSYRSVRIDLVMEQEEEKFMLEKQELNLLHTPGHTPGSMVVWGDFPEGRVLFAQDLHGPLHPDWGSNRSEWKKSLKKMLSLKADILAEGHLGVITSPEKVELFIQRFLFS